MDIKKITEHFAPFLVLGVAFTLVIGLLFMFFSLIIWGFLIGSVLWLAALIKQYLFPKKTVQKESGRIIDIDHHKS